MSKENGHFYQFGDFRLSASEGILTRGGESVRLPRKTLDLLLVLVKNANRVVGKEELMREVWADAFVEDANLTVHISTLRKTFAEVADKSVYIETFPRRGYRLIAEVKEIEEIGAERVPIEYFRETNETASGNIEEAKTNTTEIDIRETEHERQIKNAADNHKSSHRVNKNQVIVAVTAMFLLVFASGYALNKWYNKNSFINQKVVRIPGTEKSVAIAISPDGEYLAHAISNAGKRSLHILHIASNNSLQLVAPSDVLYWGLTFSNDGNYVYYVQEAKEGSALYKIPIIGGETKKVLDNVANKISFSPDGNKFAFIRQSSENATAIMIANADGSEERIIAQKKAPEFFSTFDVSWSPNNQLIAFAEGESKKDRKMQIAAINIQSGEKISFSNKKWQGTDGLAWLSDSSGVIVAAFETGAAATQIWVLPYPAGEPYKVTNDLNNYGSIGLTADSKTLLAGQFKFNSSIWLINADKQIAPKAITDSKHDDFRFINWTNDNRILYSSSASGSRDIWIMNADGTNQKQLTANARENIHPTNSPDNQFVVFSSNRNAEGTFNIWRTNIDGTNPLQLTFGTGEILPAVTPDGKWIIYTSGGTETPQLERTIWKIPAEGGEPSQVISKPSRRAAISPDGKHIACWVKEENTPWKAAIVPIEGGQPIKFLDITSDSPLRWKPDGTAVTYVKTIEGVSNVWNQPINGETPEQVTSFTNEQITNFDWSKDNRIICSRGSTTRDTLLISNFR